MRRRRTAASSDTTTLDSGAASLPLDPDTEVTAEATPSTQTDVEATAAEPVAPETEKRPRRTRRKATVEEPSTEPAPEAASETPVVTAEEAAPIADVPEKPRRTRRPRKTEAPVEEPVAAEVIAAAPAAEEATAAEIVEAPQPEVVAADPVTEEPVAETTDEEPAETPAEPLVEPVAETSEEETDEETAVADEAAPGDPATSAGSRRNRRGRGRSRRGSGTGETGTAAEPTEPSVAVPTGPTRKRGPKVLALLRPLPPLPITAFEAPVVDTTGEDLPAPVAVAVSSRRRGVRTPVTNRRFITPDGVVVLSAEQAEALLSGIVAPIEPGETAETLLPAPLLPLLPVAPASTRYQPLPEQTLARLPEVRVQKTNGVPELTINGTAVLPAFLFVNTEVAEDAEIAREIAVRQIRRAYAAGVRCFTLLVHLPWKRRSGERRYDSLDELFALIAENAPEGYVLPRLIFSPPASWERANPEEMALYRDEETGDVSIGSDAFWTGEAVDTLRAAMEHIAQSDHAARVLGVYLEHGEWFNPKGVGPDRSVANTAAFRKWLKAHYDNNIVNLRSAWFDGSVTFETAEVPAPEVVVDLQNIGGTQPVFLSDRETRLIDFFTYTSDITAQRITALAAVAKEASGNRIAVAASYGYTLEIARPGSGHYALANVLASPDVDILTAPVSYAGRTPGGSAPLPVPVDSVHLAGKLFVFEDDTKTHLAQRETEDFYNPKVASAEATRAVHARNFGTALTHGAGIAWFDTWGEGWLDDDAIWEDLGDLLHVADTVSAQRRSGSEQVAAPDVAVFVDERSFFDVRGGEEPVLLQQLIGRHRDVFARSGAQVGYYLLSDLAKPEFPDSIKLFVFLNAFHLPLPVRLALQNRWQNDGRTFTWLFAPGVREASNIAELSEVLGIQLRLQPWGSRTGTQITDGKSLLTDSAKGQRFGEDRRCNPSFTVVDPKALILGEYALSGNPSLAVRKHARWQSVFIGERELPLPLLRGLYRLAGVETVTGDDAAVQVASDGVVCWHAAMGGGATVFAPNRSEAAVYDVLNNELLAGPGYGARITVTQRSTRLIVFASPEALSARFNVPTEAFAKAPAGLTQEELPTQAPPFVFETSGTAAQPVGPQPTRLYPVELSVSPEDIALFEAALAGEIALLDKDDSGAAATPAAEMEAAEAANKKRRRRRRRGGRGEETTLPDSDLSEGAEDEDAEAGLAEAEVDEGAANALFELADLTASATVFDPDMILPLVGGDGEPATDEAESETPLTDPVADLMARLFTLQEMPESASAEAPSTETPRRPTLEELLPLSDAPDDAQLPPVPDELLPLEASTDASAEAAPAAEPEEADASAESPVGLLAGIGRRRRGSSSAGGFASRLRRRSASRETNETPEEGEEVPPPPAPSPDAAGEGE